MKNKIRKIIVSSIFVFLTTIASACWYSKSNYTDYIYSINDNKVIEVTEANGTATYIVQNNKVVDFPLTISMKLISNDQVILNDTTQTQTIPELLRGKLQYRVLPGGNWVTVSEYNTPTGTIPKDSVPSTYFGKNNIWPKGCKAGDVIMIRLYITDGMWESGEISNTCEDKLTTITTPYGNKTALPNSFSYTMDGRDILNNDLGGAWYPHLAMTVVFSGKERPLK